jgi:uncharacterized membrane protein YjfL (UPF0719 family)
MEALALKPILASILYALIGVAIFGLVFWIIDALTPYQLWKEMVEQRNTALAIVVGSVAISIAIIVSSAIH